MGFKSKTRAKNINKNNQVHKVNGLIFPSLSHFQGLKEIDL